MREFTDKVTLITGAGKGLGREIALAFSTLGAKVAANDINPLGVERTIDTIRNAEGTGSSFVFDIAKRMPVEGLVAQVLEQFGRIDFLVNHASVKPDASVLEMDEWEFHRTLDVNLGGAFFAIQQVGRVMRQQGGGAIVNIISGAQDGAFHKGHVAYTATQAGLIGLTQAAALELADYKIRVNAVYIGQGLPAQRLSPGWDDSVYYHWIADFPEIDTGEGSALVGRVVFLCSPAASMINGQVVVCDQEING